MIVYDLDSITPLIRYCYIARTDKQRARGFRNAKTLRSDQALLLVYDSPGKRVVMMDNMSIPLCVVWISEDYKVVGKTAAMPDSGNYVSPAPVKYILECSIRIANKFKTGQTLYFKGVKP